MALIETPGHGAVNGTDGRAFALKLGAARTALGVRFPGGMIPGRRRFGRDSSGFVIGKCGSEDIPLKARNAHGC
jgi:hypothetical protein